MIKFHILTNGLEFVEIAEYVWFKAVISGYDMKIFYMATLVIHAFNPKTIWF